MWRGQLFLGLLVLGLLVGAAVFLTRYFEPTGWLLSLFLTLSSRLPSWLSFEQFLVVVVVGCLLGVVLILTVALISVALMRRSVRLARSGQEAQELVVQRATEQLKAQVQGEYERLISLSTTLTQRLDKTAILQNILRAASQVTSLPHADSTVALWVLDFEKDRMRFEMGSRCDETFFTKREFELTESPFSRLLTRTEAVRVASWQKGFPYVAGAKASQLGDATALMLVPLVIERTLLGCLVVF